MRHLNQLSQLFLTPLKISISNSSKNIKCRLPRNQTPIQIPTQGGTKISTNKTLTTKAGATSKIQNGLLLFNPTLAKLYNFSCLHTFT